MRYNRKGGSSSTQLPVTEDSKNNLQQSMGNIFQIMAFLTPYSLLFFFFLLSVFTVSVKGIIYLCGVVILYFFLSILQPASTLRLTNGKICNFFGTASVNDIPSFSTALYMFTLVYLGIPMFGKSLQNIALLLFLVAITVIDINIKLLNGCSDTFGMFFGGMFGVLIGTLFVVLISSISNGKYLFYSEYASEKIACSVPKAQSFKCNVYKNGELLTTTMT